MWLPHSPLFDLVIRISRRGATVVCKSVHHTAGRNGVASAAGVELSFHPGTKLFIDMHLIETESIAQHGDTFPCPK